MSTTPAATDASRSPHALAVIQQYGDAKNLLTLFNPDMQSRYTLDTRRAYLGHAPALFSVSEAFGAGTARSWLVVQLNDLSEFAGCKDKLPVKKLDELANIILKNYGYLRLTEMMDFFRRFKAGEYGRFYGAVDPMVITCAMREFMKERETILGRLFRQDMERQKWTDPDYVKFRRQNDAYKRKRIFYSRNFAAPDFPYEEFAPLWWLFNMGYERPDHGYIDE